MESYQMHCPTCGQVVDKRHPGEVLSHGRWNEETGRYECFDEYGPIPCISSMKKGEPIQWVSIYQLFLN